MVTTRRSFLKQSLIYGAGVGLSVYTSNLLAQTHTFSSIASNPEIKFYKKAQQKLLLKYSLRAKSRYIKLAKPQIKAHILEAGKGAPVVMLHGGGTTAANFIPLASALQKEYHLIIPDRPGCGLTDGFDYQGVPFREHAVDFLNSIFINHNLNEASIVANSMGGYWALVFALANPERINKLVLIGEPAGSSPPGQSKSRPINKYENTSLEVIRRYYEAVLVSDVNRVDTEMLKAEVAAARLPGVALAWNSMLEQIKNEKRGLTHALRPELKNLKAKTLFIWGDKDYFGLPTLGQEMAAIAPNAYCEIIQDAGHMVWLDQPESCAQLTLDFLAL